MSNGLTSEIEVLVLILSTVLLLLAFAVRCKGRISKLNIADPYYLFVGFFYLYNNLARVGRIKYDDLPNEIYNNAAIFTLIAWFGLIFGAACFPLKRGQKPIIIDETYRYMFWISGGILLASGYYLWGLNYDRLGGIFESIKHIPNRGDRNALITELRGNYPFTHFLLLAQVFLTIACHLTLRKITFSILLPFTLILPLLIFFVIEGERTSLLKHILSAFFVLVYLRYDGVLRFQWRYLYIGLALFISFSVVGNLRSSFQKYIANGDTDAIVEQMQSRGVSIILPYEFSAVNFVYNKTVADISSKRIGHEFGYTYQHSLGYVFPRSVYDAYGLIKRLSVSDIFGKRFANELKNSRKMGFGMSALGESFLNFSYFGMFMYPFLAILAINIWVELSYGTRSLFIKAWLLSLSPLFLLYHRIAFSSFFAYCVQLLAISLFVYFLSALVFLSIKRVFKEYRLILK